MGTFSVPVQVSKPYSGESVAMDALVDTGTTYCVFPGDMLEGLGIAVAENRFFETAGNHVVEFPVGYVTIGLAGKQIITLAVFGPSGVAPRIGNLALEVAGFAPDYDRQVLTPVNALLVSVFGGWEDSGVS